MNIALRLRRVGEDAVSLIEKVNQLSLSFSSFVLFKY